MKSSILQWFPLLEQRLLEITQEESQPTNISCFIESKRIYIYCQENKKNKTAHECLVNTISLDVNIKIINLPIRNLPSTTESSDW